MAIAVCGLGLTQAAVTLNIYESGGRTHFEFDGGTLNLGPSQVSVPMIDPISTNQLSAQGGTGAIGISSLYSSVPASGSRLTFATAVPMTETATWLGVNNLDFENALYEGGEWGIMAGVGDNLTVANNAPAFTNFFTITSIIDAHQSIAGGLIANGFVIGDTRTITMGEASDTYTINVIATPVPEPSSAVLTLLGCGFLALRRKRK